MLTPVVQMIFDEIKVKTGVAFNAATGKEAGFMASKNGKTMKRFLNALIHKLIFPDVHQFFLRVDTCHFQEGQMC